MGKQMKNYPLVSVIIPTFNRPGLLRQTIESVLAQSYPALECIVVDDGSTDETPRMLADYAGRFPGRIIPIRQENRGGTAARNTGARAARGDFLNFLDHDDLFLPRKIERQMMLFKARPALGLVHCGFFRIDKDGRFIDVRNHLPEGDVRVRLVQGCFLWSGAPLIRRECIDQVGLYDETVWSSDAEMWLRIALAGYLFGCVQAPLGCYRILPDSAMADVVRTEQGDISVMDRVFADPRLPAEAHRVKDQAYFNERSFLAFRYYAIGRSEDAKRNLMEAVHLKPHLLEELETLLGMIVQGILDLRVPDPVKHTDYVLDHLPSQVTRVVQPHCDAVYSRVYLTQAMRNYGWGKIGEARRQFAQAIAWNPGITSEPGRLALTVANCAIRGVGVGAPLKFIETVLRNLPAEAQSLANLRKKIIGQAVAYLAREAFRLEIRHQMPGLLVHAFRHRRAYLKDPRKLAQLAFSHPAFLMFRMKAAVTGGKNDSLEGFGPDFVSALDLMQRK
jgi:glycosyltransferase involved in cell wall biosynthesis